MSASLVVGLRPAGRMRLTARASKSGLTGLTVAYAPPEGVPHSWAKSADGVTVAYHRDRGEKLNPAKRYTSIEDYLANAIGDAGASYAYLFEDGKWFFRTAGKNELLELNIETAK